MGCVLGGFRVEGRLKISMISVLNIDSRNWMLWTCNRIRRWLQNTQILVALTITKRVNINISDTL